MSTKTPSSPPRRRLLLLGAAGVAVLVAVVLIVVSQLSDDEDSGGDRAAAVTQAAPTTAAETAPAASEATAAETGTPAETSAGATTVASTLPYVEEVQTLLAGLQQDGTILGDPAAPVTVVEFADLRCPVCRLWDTQELPILLDEAVRPGTAKIDLQVVSILGPDSDRAAEGAWAAVAQNKLWPFSMLWFFNQGPETEEYATDEYQRAIAAGAGLDVEQFDRDRAGSEAADQAAAALQRARDAQFQGTPAFVVTGPGGTFPFVEGNVPTAQTLLDAVEQARG
jgi:protein-disulfide isomerase